MGARGSEHFCGGDPQGAIRTASPGEGERARKASSSCACRGPAACARLHSAWWRRTSGFQPPPYHRRPPASKIRSSVMPCPSPTASNRTRGSDLLKMIVVPSSLHRRVPPHSRQAWDMHMVCQCSSTRSCKLALSTGDALHHVGVGCKSSMISTCRTTQTMEATALAGCISLLLCSDSMPSSGLSLTLHQCATHVTSSSTTRSTIESDASM